MFRQDQSCSMLLLGALLVLSSSTASSQPTEKNTILMQDECDEEASQKQPAPPILKVNSIKENDALLGGTTVRLILLNSISASPRRTGNFRAKTFQNLTGVLGTIVPAGTLIEGSFSTDPEPGNQTITIKFWSMELNTDNGKFSTGFDAVIRKSITTKHLYPNLLSNNYGLSRIQSPSGTEFINCVLIERPWLSPDSMPKLGTTESSSDKELCPETVYHQGGMTFDYARLKTSLLQGGSIFDVMLNTIVFLPKRKDENWGNHAQAENKENSRFYADLQH